MLRMPNVVGCGPTLAIGTSISYVKLVTALYDKNCDREKFQSRYCIVTDRKTARTSEIVSWVSL